MIGPVKICKTGQMMQQPQYMTDNSALDLETTRRNSSSM